MSSTPGTESEDEPELSEEEEERLAAIRNPQLKEVLDFYNCYDLLPYANHILWLSTVREAVGSIPFSLDYEDICCLVILAEEISKKATADSQRMQQKEQSLATYVTPKIKK